MTSDRQSFSREAPDARRQSLIEATARCLAKRGVGGTSVRAICNEAGVSAGLLRHYFASIDDVIADTYRWTGGRVQTALDEAAAQHGSPRTRLLAYLNASFRTPISEPDLLATWLAFWSLTRTNKTIATIHAQIYKEYRQKLETLLTALVPEQSERQNTAIALTALVDGLWLELSLGNAPFSAQEAERLVERWLSQMT